MKKNAWYLTFLLFFALFTSTLAAQEREIDLGDDRDFTVAISPKNFVESPFAREIGKTEEWKAFYSTLTAKMDQGYDAAKNVPGFPTDIDSWFQGVLGGALKKPKVDSADLIEWVFGNIQAMFLQGELEFREDKVDLAPDATFSVVIRFDPAMFAGISKFIKKDEHYKLVKQDEKLTLIASMDDKLVVGTARWKDSEYFLIVAGSKPEYVEKQIGRFQNLDPERTLSKFEATAYYVDISPTAQTRERFKTWSKTIAVTVDDKKKQDDLAGFTAIFNNIVSVQVRMENLDGISTITKTIDANSEDAASQIRSMSEGGVALLRFFLSGRELKPEEKMLAACLEKVRVETNGKTVKASCPLGKEASDFVRFCLEKGTEEMKKN